MSTTRGGAGMVRLLRLIIFLLLAIGLAATASAQVFVNVSTGDPDDNTTQNEAHIAVSGQIVVVGWNDATQALGAGVSWTGYGYSTDGGETWTDAGTLVPVTNGQNRGDPVLAVDRGGTFYFATLARDSASARYVGVAQSTSTSPAVTFGLPVLITGGNSSFLQDKPWLAVDTTGGTYDGRVYVCWKDFSDGRIRFVGSTNTAPLTFGVSQALSPTGQGCNIAVGPAGEVYVTWITGMGTTSQAIHVRKSTDGGGTFGTDATVATPARSGDATASASCGRRALDANIRVADFPVIAADHSGGAFNGSVYIAYSGDPDGTGADEADVFVTRSPANPGAPLAGDPGVSWSTPVSITKAPSVTSNADTTTNDNWLPAIAVSPSNGTTEVIFYDRRNDTTSTDGDPANTRIDVFKAISTDGGVTWTNRRITPTSFGVPQLLPNFNSLTGDCYMGDYNGLAARGADFFLAWGDNSNVVTTTNFPTGRPDPDVRYSSEAAGALCALFPVSRCGSIPIETLHKDGLIIRFDIKDWVWVETIDKECWFKWPCPGCGAGPAGLCAFAYTVIFDFAKAGLDPDVLRIRLLDFRGRDIERVRVIGGRKVFTFRPKSFAEGGVGEKMFFAFQLGPKGKTKTEYKVPVFLKIERI